jgi:large subunit ribosomal protein L21
MYAVVSSGGKQYRVEPGSTLLVERLASQPGASILFDRVLLIGDGDEVTVGTPVVTGASVSGTILAEELGPKLVIFKFKQKVKYRRRTGHRQHLLRVRIDEINADGRRPAKSRAKAEAEPQKAAAEAEPKPRASRARAAKAKEPPAGAETSAPKTSARKASAPKASASQEDAAEKPKRRSPRPKAETTKKPATAAKADTAEQAEE